MISINQIEQLYPENLRGFKRNILREYLQYKILELIFNSRLASSLSAILFKMIALSVTEVFPQASLAA